MKVTFLGATHEVTGSCTLIEVGGHKLLVDCGMEQGQDMFENQTLPVSPSDVECVLLTHAHIDHSGNLPLLSKGGFTGTVYATEATCALSNVMLRDSAHIQEFEAEWRNRKAKRSGGELYTPLYSMADAEAILQSMRPCRYGERIRILENVEIRFTDVGHLLGSGAIEVFLRENGVEKTIVFSGDVGNTDRPILNNPKHVSEADYVVIESTYGIRNHEKSSVNSVEYLASVLEDTFRRGGNVVIPSFAVGRTQEILYYLREVKARGLVTVRPDFKVYMDSPLAQEATRIFIQCAPDFVEPEVASLFRRGVNPFWVDGLVLAESSEESKAINFDEDPKVIISASGMCEAGRVRHHLKHNLWRSDSTVLFVGYQAVGTLGRSLYEGAKKVRIFSEEIEVKAKICYLPGVSGHADQTGLLSWLAGFEKYPAHVFVNHGDDEAVEGFTEKLTSLGYSASAPHSGTSYDLLTGGHVEMTVGIPVEKKTPGSERAKAAYEDLLRAAEELLALAKTMKGRPNKDLSKFASRIRELLKKQK